MKLIFISLAALLAVLAGWAIAHFGIEALLIIILLAVAVFITWQTIRDPFWGFLGIIFFLPFERVPTVNFGGVDIKINIVLGFLTLVSWILALLANPKKYKIQPAPVWPLLLLFILAMFASIWQAVNFGRAQQVLIFILFTMSIGILSLNMITSVKNLNKIITVLFVSALAVSLFGFFQFFGDLAHIPISVTLLKDIYTKEVFGFPRIQAFSMEPLYFANYLLIPICLSLSYFFGKIKKSPDPEEENKFLDNRLNLVLFLMILLINFVLTVSRGAYIALIVALILLFFVYFRRVFTWKNILIFIITAVVVGYGVVFALSKGEFRATNEFVGHVLLKDINAGESIQGRLQGFRSALTQFNKSPIFGVGLGNYGPNVSGKPYVNPPGGWPIVNNQYIETLTETGIVGLTTLLLFLIALIWQGLKAYRRAQDPFLKATMLGLLAAFIGILVQYNSFSTLYIIHIWVLIGLLIGVQNLIVKKESL